MQTWRWDQGRIAYFNFNNIKSIASALNTLDGIELSGKQGDPVRALMEAETGLPFLPISYAVWRNYARIFKAELLATRIDGKLTVTEICQKIATSTEDAWEVDDYLAILISRFYYPSPVFEGYDTSSPQIFPFCVLLRYLLAQHSITGDASITLEEIFSLLVGNECNGTEPIEYYLNLKHTARQPLGDEERQVREMLTFIGQSSFLKWSKNRLYLDLLPGDNEIFHDVMEIATPLIRTRHEDKDAELLALGALSGLGLPVRIKTARELPSDITFTEGKRVRRTHLRVERSPRLRNLFLSSLSKPIFCDMCGMDTNQRYPWTNNLLEVHHLLPLSSVINFEGTETSFADLVALCPNCHKSIHVYYAKWLSSNSFDDFSSGLDAKNAYTEAKTLINLEG